MSLTRENQVNVIGTLETIELTPAADDKGTPLVKGKLVVKVMKPREMSIPFNFYVAATTKANKPRQLYKQLKDLRLNQRINITGSISDNKFFDTARGQLVHSSRLNINFINPVDAKSEDTATFSFSGFVKEPLKPMMDSDDKITGYSITMGQDNYNNTRPEIIKFNVDPYNTIALNYIEKEFTKGRTFKVSGELNFDVVSVTRTEEVAFGTPIVKTFQRNVKELIITSAALVSEGVYETADINDLMAKDEAHDREVEAAERAKEKSGAVTSTAKPLFPGSDLKTLI